MDGHFIVKRVCSAGGDHAKSPYLRFRRGWRSCSTLLLLQKFAVSERDIELVCKPIALGSGHRRYFIRFPHSGMHSLNPAAHARRWARAVVIWASFASQVFADAPQRSWLAVPCLATFFSDTPFSQHPRPPCLEAGPA